MLHWDEFGDPAGTPVLHFHGTPGSRREAAVLDGAARAVGVRLVAPDRPGMGRTPHVPGRRLAHFPADVVELLDALEIERVGILAWSGGGPYALACLARIPERLTGVALLAPAGLLPRLPWANRLVPHLSMPLQALLARAPWGRNALAVSWREAFRQGPAGPVRDELVINEDWSGLLRPARRASSGRSGVPVRIWHGRRDRTVPPRHSRRLSRALGAPLTDAPREDHAGALLTGGPQALGFLAAAARAQTSSNRSMPPR